jgi:hypothetical protein
MRCSNRRSSAVAVACTVKPVDSTPDVSRARWSHHSRRAALDCFRVVILVPQLSRRLESGRTASCRPEDRASRRMARHPRRNPRGVVTHCGTDLAHHDGETGASQAGAIDFGRYAWFSSLSSFRRLASRSSVAVSAATGSAPEAVRAAWSM